MIFAKGAMMTGLKTHRLRSACLFGLMLVFRVVSTAPAVADDSSKYTDEKYSFSLTVSAPWKSARLQNYTVPGVVRAAWSGPNGASIVAFVQEPGSAFSPRFLVDASAKAMKEKLGAKVIAQEVKTVSGKQAMWMIVEGQGTGGAITGNGNVATTQHWVAIPREKDVVVLLLTSPNADYEAVKKSFAQAVASMTVGGNQTEEQKTAK